MHDPEKAALIARLQRAEAERDELLRVLHGLTPGGSEYANDAKACAEYVLHSRRSMFRNLKRYKAERDEALRKVERLRSMERVVRQEIKMLRLLEIGLRARDFDRETEPRLWAFRENALLRCRTAAQELRAALEDTRE